MLEIYKMFPFLICKIQSHKAFQHFSTRLKQRTILVLTKFNLKNRLLLQLFKADLDLDLDLFDFSNICHKDWSKKLFLFYRGTLTMMNRELIESLFKY